MSKQSNSCLSGLHIELLVLQLQVDHPVLAVYNADGSAPTGGGSRLIPRSSISLSSIKARKTNGTMHLTGSLIYRRHNRYIQTYYKIVQQQISG